MGKFKLHEGKLMQTDEPGEYEPFFVIELNCSSWRQYYVTLWYPCKESRTFQVVHAWAWEKLRSASLNEEIIQVLIQ